MVIFVYMECLGTPNFAAMAVSTSAPWRPRRRKMRPENACFSHWESSHLPSLRLRASTGSESCVAVNEGFADEEDYIKAGGSELFFVQMQQNKEMDEQSKLADKVRLLCGGEQPDRVIVLYRPLFRKTLILSGISSHLKFGSFWLISVPCYSLI